ncbi:MAG: hypothetical protein M3R46_15990 [Actinomycetota bacterium]|nr:hypothetical protein [Actinomycetota bacterium]
MRASDDPVEALRETLERTQIAVLERPQIEADEERIEIPARDQSPRDASVDPAEGGWYFELPSTTFVINYPLPHRGPSDGVPVSDVGEPCGRVRASRFGGLKEVAKSVAVRRRCSCLQLEPDTAGHVKLPALYGLVRLADEVFGPGEGVCTLGRRDLPEVDHEVERIKPMRPSPLP